jgi:anti-sigma regulatory factor (Ser/Thr protein kinase)
MTAQGAPSSLVLELPASGLSVREVRATLVSLLVGSPYSQRLADAQTAATELVTNAVLHGRRPIRVHIDYDFTRLRVAVTDASPVSPTFSLLDPTAVTGRGLLLVSAVSDAWGVEPGAGEKTVWAEFRSLRASAEEEADVDALLDAWADELEVDPALEVVRVVLTDLDTERLTANEVYVEGVLRELTLVAADERCETGLRELATRILTAADALEAARVDLRRQLAAAVAHDVPKVDIELSITRHHAELVRDYRDALAQADRLCTSGRLLHEAPGAAALWARQDYLGRILAQLSS